MTQRFEVFDLHTDVLNKLAGTSVQPGTPSVNAESLSRGGVTRACFACYCGRDTRTEAQLAAVEKQSAVLEQLRGHMGECRVYGAFEGLDYFYPEIPTELIKRVKPVYATLTWNHASPICGSCAVDYRLTPFGKRVLRFLEKNGIRADLSHAGREAFWSVLDNTPLPIVTHSCADAVTQHRRNLTDEQIRALIRRGSVIGLNFYSEFCGGTMESLVKHALHILDMGGEKCLALGSDFDGCSALPAGLEGPEGFPRLAQALLAAGAGENILRDIFSNNARRVLLGE